jgi:hypothetical protein
MRKPGYRSKNRYREFLKVSRLISGKISEIPGVVGIIATGGVGRGHSDDFSDLDLIVYVRDSRYREIDRYIAVGGLRHKGIELDTPVVSYEKALKHKSPSAYWSQVRRWDRQNSKILFDTRGRIKSLLKAKLVFPDRERDKLMMRHSRKVTDFLIYNFELWAKRGRPHNLAHTLLQATEHLILWIYAKNREFQPYVPKWLFYHLEAGRVPEARYLSTIRKPFTSPIRTMSDARKIRDRLIDLCDGIGLPLEFRTPLEVFEEEKLNWEKASDKTRHYLGW